MFKTLEWTDEGVVMIDQRKLPGEELYPIFKSYQEVAQAIKDMVVRGAPAIGVAAAMGIALGAQSIQSDEPDGFEKEFDSICKAFSETRPTAVNLFWAIDRMKKICKGHLQDGDLAGLKILLRDEAVRMHREDIALNRRMGLYGATLLKTDSRVLTHCNAGALATAGFGTALGVIRAAIEQGKHIHVYTDETRPFLQGARLTAWELQKDDIPVTLITDNMAGHFMKNGNIDYVIVGADRIAGNGDVANKIGTYSVAVLAKENGIPFYVAAPVSTLDLSLSSGEQIPIEQRPSREVTHIGSTPIAPEGIEVANPAFDVTPNRYVTAIITENGIARPPYVESLRKLAPSA
jgi:methylthioribose-1-phosphate isomerase